jgi:hypothetical protein
MEATRHSLLDNKVQLYKRPNTPHWQCACSVGGKQIRSTTKEESLARAKDVARDWYLGLLGKYRAGELKAGKKFKEVAQRFLDEFEVITQGERSPAYVQGHKDRVKNHLNPFFGEKVVSEINPGLVQDYRIHRMKTGMARSAQLSQRGGPEPSVSSSFGAVSRDMRSSCRIAESQCLQSAEARESCGPGGVRLRRSNLAGFWIF